jgi:hypothetical protein
VATCRPHRSEVRTNVVLLVVEVSQLCSQETSYVEN